MIDHIVRFVAPAAYSLLPPHLDSPGATAMVLACGLQESQFLARRQHRGGPARSFWEFEVEGVAGVLRHHTTQVHVEEVLRALRYPHAVGHPSACHAAIEHNDTLAFVFARLLLWTLPSRLPARGDPLNAWQQYLATWRPGVPRPADWAANYLEAWDRVALTDGGLDEARPPETPS